MKIKLTKDLPIADRHGAKKGEVFEVVRDDFQGRGNSGYYFKGKDGQSAKLFWENVKLLKKNKKITKEFYEKRYIRF